MDGGTGQGERKPTRQHEQTDKRATVKVHTAAYKGDEKEARGNRKEERKKYAIQASRSSFS